VAPCGRGLPLLVLLLTVVKSTMSIVARRRCLSPESSMQAHSAPLGITFYNYADNVPDDCDGTFPKEMDGYAFVVFHGSWNRDVPTGYKVVYVPMNGDWCMPDGEEARDLLRREGSGAQWSNGFRPVDVDFDACGWLVVTSDGTSGSGSEIVRISFFQTSLVPTLPPTTPINPPTTSPPTFFQSSMVPTLPPMTISVSPNNPPVTSLPTFFQSSIAPTLPPTTVSPINPPDSTSMASVVTAPVQVILLLMAALFIKLLF
jgi:hypothetical protein